MLVGSLLATGWASGVNLYATVLLLGLLGRMGVGPTPEVLQSPWVLGVAGVMYVVEFVADKVPVVDNVWDVLHTVVRPVGAGLIGGQLTGGDLSMLVGGGMSGAMAFGAHAVKASTRLAVNTSPEPVTNIGVSVAEDVVVAAMVWLALTHPWVAGTAAVVLLVAGVVLVVAVWRLVRRGLARVRRQDRVRLGVS